jgi:hypothetical protein
VEGIENYLIFKDTENRTVFQRGADANGWLTDVRKELNLPKNNLYQIEPSYRSRLGLPPGNSDVYIYVK